MQTAFVRGRPTSLEGTVWFMNHSRLQSHLESAEGQPCASFVAEWWYAWSPVFLSHEHPKIQVA